MFAYCLPYSVFVPVRSICCLPEEKSEMIRKNHVHLQSVVNSNGPFVLLLNENDCVFQTDNTAKNVVVISSGNCRRVRLVLCVSLFVWCESSVGASSLSGSVLS